MTFGGCTMTDLADDIKQKLVFYKRNRAFSIKYFDKAIKAVNRLILS